MVLTRGIGADGQAQNITTPYVDQSQTLWFTSITELFLA
jgi:hypothetical protein